MKRVLRAAHYPNLDSLALYNIDEETIQCLFTGNDSLHPNIPSSTLLKLNVKVQHFNDCLYLFDGRFNQLRTFYVDLVCIRGLYGRRPHVITNQVFLSPNYETSDYDELIPSLLYRMSNLEKLGLHLRVDVNETF
ncbi:unnamed protein product [Rotaria magnacalcarata]|uniref:Uncharacterized protein n=3 Tax=Rotaria magnacalcarata TaxID=392030 RepID=A0A815WMU8_9BILA|nr:unnamed protein product [Rotaria magnacalcarata]